MPLQIVRNDITKLDCDAIVNAANPTLLGGGGVDGAIHKDAGEELLLACRELGGCKPGEAKITKGYRLPSKYVIHTVGPKWKGGNDGEEALLRSCYRRSLAIAASYQMESIAFPLISSGVYGYPKEQALKIAVEEITAFLMENEILVFLVIYDKSSYQIGENLFHDIASFIDDHYVDEHSVRDRRNETTGESVALSESIEMPSAAKVEDLTEKKRSFFAGILPAVPTRSGRKKYSSLDVALAKIDESFSEMLLRKIDEKGMTDAECYKKANIDRKLFSKIRNNPLYKPSKTTAIAFAIALELSLPETKEMLMKAGFALSHSNKFDIIIEYFITKGNYNIFEINETLFAFDQSLLGA